MVIGRISFYMGMPIFILHSLYNFFLFRLVSQHVHQIDGFSFRVSGAFQYIGYPGIGLSAYINKYVTGGYLQDIRHGGLETVHVCSIAKKQGKIHVIRLVTQNFFYPVVFRENCSYYLKPLAV